MKILISAAESSSDAHAAELLKALRTLDPQIRAFGIGGEKLQKAGLRCVIRAEELLVMGFTEILGRIPHIAQMLRKIERSAQWERPDLAIVLDYPDFHFRLIKKLKKLGIPVVYYIPPKIWVWRKRRAKFLKKWVDLILGVFPFEVPFYAFLGVSMKYVGNPLMDELPIGITRDEAIRKLGIANSIGDRPTKIVTLMPGSRPAELRRHFKFMLESVKLMTSLLSERLFVLIPIPDASRAEWARKQYFEWLNELPPGQRDRFSVRISSGDSAYCLAASDAGIIKSGTSTLEAAILGCPHTVLYRPSEISCFIFKTFVRYSGFIGLSNLILGKPPAPGTKPALPRPVFREFYCDQAQTHTVSRELYALLKQPDRMEECQAAIREVREVLSGQGQGSPFESPSLVAAREILELARGRRVLRKQRSKPLLAARPVFIWLSSALWSTVNAIMGVALRRGWIRPERLNARVISVGNIQSGGSGKTPLVALLAEQAIARGFRVCILTRGYGGLWEDMGGVIQPGDEAVDANLSGDEPALLQERVPAATIAVGADRVSAFQRAVELSGQEFDWVILDDGLQNFRIQKDLEVVAVTSKKRSEVLYREWGSKLRQADLLVWTKGERMPFAPAAQPFTHLKFSYPQVSLEGASAVFLITSIADGDLVRKMLEERQVPVEVHMKLRDHAHFALADARRWAEDASARGLRLAMTGKDFVKWKKLGIPNPVLRLEPDFEIVEGQAVWDRIFWGESTRLP